MTAVRKVFQAPSQAVSNGVCQMGTYNSPISELNLLEANKPLGLDLPKPIKYMRLKEWQAFQFDNAQWFMCFAVYNTKSLGTAIIMAYNKQEKRMYRYEHKVPFWKLKVPTGLSDTHCYYHHKNLRIHFHNDIENGSISISFHAYGFKGCPDISGQLSAHAVTEPIVIVQPFAENRPLYSHKALMPAEGHIACNGKVTQSPINESCMIVDDHKGYYPLEMKYDWVTALGYSEEGVLQGFNLTDNQIQRPAEFNENCVWFEGKMYPLPPIRIKRPDGVENDWVIQDENGQVDLKFTPLADVPVKVGLGIKLVDYHGPTGQVSGHVVTADGEKIQFNQTLGMGERKLIRM